MNGAELAFAAWRADEERVRQQDVVMARRFHEGEHEVALTEALKGFLGGDSARFNVNMCRTVVEAVTERMMIADVGAAGDASAAFARDLWERNQMALRQAQVHEWGLVDGESFVIVSWSDEEQRVVLTPTSRYTDAQVDGDNFGGKAHYPNDDMMQPLLFCSKRWVETLENGRARQRATLYWPDRVEKYQVVAGSLVEFRDDGDAGWPLPWLDRNGRPLGSAMEHLYGQPSLRPEAWDAIPIQNGLNKGVVDMLATADLTAFRMFVAFGWIPTTDGRPLAADSSNMARIGPGTILGTTRPRSEVDFTAIDGADVRPMIEMLQSMIGWLAVVTNTPESRLSFTRQIAAEGTLQEQKETLYAKIRKRQALFDAGWKRVLERARRVQDAKGAPVGDESPFLIDWAPIQSRDTADERDEWRVKREMGVPTEQIWSEMGYSVEQVEKMKATDEYRLRMAAAAAGWGENG